MASDPIVPLPPSWPAMSLDEVEALLTAPGARFEMETVPIGGVATRVWKNAPPSLRMLLEASAGHGARTFVVHEDERVSYTGFVRATARLAAHLAASGVGKGDRVAVAMRNLPEWPVAFFAAAAIGAIVVPLNAWWAGSELEYGLSDSGTKLLLVDGERHDRLAGHYPALPALERVIVTRARGPLAGAERLEDVIGAPNDWATLPDAPLPPAQIAPDDDATIFYTSGTTGAPKGALGTHRNIMTNILSSGYTAARAYLRRGEVPPEPSPRVSLAVIPLFHVTGCSAGLMGMIATGSTLVMMRKWDAGQALALIERERVTMTGGVPTIAWQLLEHPDRAKYDPFNFYKLVNL